MKTDGPIKGAGVSTQQWARREVEVASQGEGGHGGGLLMDND